MKTRDLPIGTFIEILQHESIQALIRAKVFPRKKDKDFWLSTFESKKEKVEKLCEANGVESIFDSKSKWKEILSKVMPEKGIPNFTYKHEKQRLGDGYYPGLQELDERYYFNLDSEVVHEGKIYTISNVDEESCTIKDSENQSIQRVPKSELRRLFLITQ